MISHNEQETIKTIRKWIKDKLGAEWKCVSVSRYEGNSYGGGSWVAIASNGDKMQDGLFSYDRYGSLCWHEPIYRQETEQGA
jgi:hypothetical protein